MYCSTVLDSIACAGPIGRLLLRSGWIWAAFEARAPWKREPASGSQSNRIRIVSGAVRVANAQASIECSVHWCPDTPPTLGSVLRVVKFELGDQSPKLNLVAIR